MKLTEDQQRALFLALKQDVTVEALAIVLNTQREFHIHNALMAIRSNNTHKAVREEAKAEAYSEILPLLVRKAEAAKPKQV